jgi:hypothetical protein
VALVSNSEQCSSLVRLGLPQLMPQSLVEGRRRLVDGSGVGVDKCDQHADAFTEHTRWLTNEGEAVQALGRSRGLRRTSATRSSFQTLQVKEAKAA